MNKQINDEIEKGIENKIEEKLELFARGKDDRKSCSRSKHLFGRIFWGLFFLVAAAGLASQIFGIVTYDINIWWVILCIFLVAIMIKSLISLNWFGVFVPAAVVVTILNYQTDLIQVSNEGIGGSYAVAVLLAIAFSILFHRRNRGWVGFHGKIGHSKSDEIVDGKDGKEVAVSARFSSTIKYVNSDNLEKVLVDCSFGAIKLYFDNAKPGKDGAVIDINCSFGGVEMYVPKNWNIANGLNTGFGGIEEKNRAVLNDGSPVVKLVGDISFSGVTIIYV